MEGGSKLDLLLTAQDLYGNAGPSVTYPITNVTLLPAKQSIVTAQDFGNGSTVLHVQ